MPKYTKSLSADFNGTFNSSQFHDEIKLNINKNLKGVNVFDDIVEIEFQSDLDNGEQTVLDSLITNHIPVIVNSNSHYGALNSDPIISNPMAGDKYYNTTINHEMCFDASRNKWLSVAILVDGAGRNGSTKGGTFYRRLSGMKMSATLGPYVQKGTIIRIGYATSKAVSHTYQVLVNGVVKAELPSNGSACASGDFDVDFDEGVLSSKNKAGSSTTSNLQSVIYYKIRS
jgi:hypothetical protein